MELSAAHTPMSTPHLNWKHLHYFWVVAKSGGVAKAGEQLHVTPQSISTQMRQLEQSIGDKLWRRAGRKLELTDTGHLVFEHAERLFAVGEELKTALADRGSTRTQRLHVGVTGSVVKVVAYRLIAPVLALPAAPRLECREGRLHELLARLAVHELDVVLSDRPMPATMNVKAFNRVLLESGISFMAAPALAKKLFGRGFPQSLHGAPMLLPGGDSAMRPALLAWFDALGIAPRVIADFDDTAVMKAFGQAGAGVFPMPSYVEAETERQFHVHTLGRTRDVLHQVWAVSTERRLSNPGVRAIHEAAPGPGVVGAAEGSALSAGAAAPRATAPRQPAARSPRS